jgi:predicted dehydrogenase
MGIQHIEAIKKSKKAILHSIVDINSNAEIVSKKYKSKLFRRIEDLLKSNKPDGVIVATPNQLHEKHSNIFLKNKIPVLLEKPISHEISSAKKIFNFSKKYKTSLLIGFHRRHNQIISKVKNILSSKKLGKVVSANVLCWFYKHKEYYKTKWRTKKGGGPLNINLVHDLDIVCYLLGTVKYVQAFKSNKIRKFNIEDTASINLIFNSGALCTLNVSDTIVSPWSYELTAGENPVYPITNQSAYYIGGTEGSIQFPNLKLWTYKKERSWWNKILVKNNRDKKDSKTLVNQIDHFADVINKKAKPKVSGEDGLNLLKIFKAIEKSSKTGQKVKV